MKRSRTPVPRRSRCTANPVKRGNSLTQIVFQALRISATAKRPAGGNSDFSVEPIRFIETGRFIETADGTTTAISLRALGCLHRSAYRRHQRFEVEGRVVAMAIDKEGRGAIHPAADAPVEIRPH